MTFMRHLSSPSQKDQYYFDFIDRNLDVYTT